MKLHAKYRPRLVPNSHDDVVVFRPGRDSKIPWQPVAGNCQGVIAADLEGVAEAGKQARPVVRDLRGLSMHRRARAFNATTERNRERLMSEAHAEHRQASRELLQSRDGDACAFGTP